MSEHRHSALEPLLARLTELRPIDRLLGWMLLRPRAVQGGAATLCAALIALSVTGGAADVSPHAAGERAPEVADAPAQASPEERDEPVEQAIAAVAAYNRASIIAAREGRVEHLLPHLHPSGAAIAQARAEYDRRAGLGETHDARLRRWGVLSAEASGAWVTVETQELWDVVVWSEGKIVSSRRGVLTRNIYRLQRAGAWLIADVTTEIVVQ